MNISNEYWKLNTILLQAVNNAYNYSPGPELHCKYSK